MGLRVDTRKNIPLSGQTYELAGDLDKYDFFLDLGDRTNGTEGMHQKVTRVAKDLQDEKPGHVYYRIPLAANAEDAAWMSENKHPNRTVYESQTLKGKRVLFETMLKSLEGRKKRDAGWEGIFADKAYLLTYPYSLIRLEQIVDRKDKKILEEYESLVLVDNDLSTGNGQDYELGSKVFEITEHDGHVEVNCSGCSKPRSFVAIPNTSTDRNNGMLVVESSRCEHCANGYKVSFDQSVQLKDVLDNRN